MGAFRDFFTGLFGKIKEIPDKISELIVKMDFIVVFLGDIKEGITDFFDRVKGIAFEGRKLNRLYPLQWCKTVACLDGHWSKMPEDLRSDPELKELYDTKREELKAEGMDTAASLAGGLVGKGVQWGVNAITTAALENIQPVIDDFFEGYKGDPNDKVIVDKLAASGEFGLNAVVGFMLGHFLSPVISTSLAPAWEGMGQVAWKALPVKLADPGTLIRLKYRGLISDEVFREQLKKQGVGDEVRKLYEDGYLYYPSPAELVNWQAKEVFEPAMITKYGLDAELGGLERDAFYKAGMNDEQITNFWRAHWEHPAWTAIVEMLHRGQMTEADVRDWFRLVEIPPFWRDKMINVSWAVPTRVDVRRFWDMRTITEARLREIYEHRGYHGKDLDDYVLWTKVYTEFPSLMARYKNGWVTTGEVESELVRLGMPADRAKTMIEEKIKKEAAGRTTKERDLTKAEIVKGVKKEVITLDQGQELLEDMGYDADEAEYILAINIEAAKGSPEMFWEFKKLTELEKLAEGREGKRVPETLIEAEKKYRKHPERADLELEYREEMTKWEEEE